MSKTVIEVNKIGKEFYMGEIEGYETLRDSIMRLPKKIFRRGKSPKKFWSLKDISFEVKKGEVLGLIGKNGAGKSTLLKILSRIIPPTKGTATIQGRTASMLEVGTGFHPELTGRENVYLNGAILGMSRSEIDKKFKKIVEFSEIGKFLDMPVKHYSSGMRVRLAFSVAAHLEPEILLIDEVLAVGDVGFKRKSLNKMHSIAKDEGRTVVFVSHNLGAIDTLCDRALLLEKGKLVSKGPVRKVISDYVDKYISDKIEEDKYKEKSRPGTGDLRVTNFWIENENRKKTHFLTSGDKYYLVFKYKSSSNTALRNVDFGFAVSTLMQQPLFIHYLSFTDQQLEICPPKGKFVFKFDKFPLAKGHYSIGFRATVENKVADYYQSAIKFTVESGDFYKTGIPIDQKHSPLLVQGEWRLEK